MSFNNQSKVEYKSLPTSGSSSRPGLSTALELDDRGNIFDQRKNWDEFKKEYYQLEKKIKKALENLHSTQIEFTKHISLLEYILLFSIFQGLKEQHLSIKKVYIMIFKAFQVRLK